MAWRTIVEANSPEEFQSKQASVRELAAGTPVTIHINLSTAASILGIGLSAKLAGAELWAAKLVNAHIDVEDVDGGWDYIEIKGRTIGTPVTLIVFAIIAALAALGITAWMIRDIRLSADLVKREEIQAQETQQLIEAGWTPEQITTYREAAKLEAPTGGIDFGGIAILAVVGILAVGALTLFKAK